MSECPILIMITDNGYFYPIEAPPGMPLDVFAAQSGEFNEHIRRVEDTDAQ